MTKILGLDLGTNSIGWAVVDEEKKFKKPSMFKLADKGVHIFSEGVKNEKGIESSKAAERTKYRSARRLKFRRKLRKYETLKVLRENDMCPITKDELEKWFKYIDDKGKVKRFKHYPSSKEFIDWLKTDDNTGINPYYFRAKAVTEKIPLLEIGRAFYHLAQRRGFLSNRFEITDDVSFEEVKNDIKEALENENEISSLKYALECIKSKYVFENDENNEDQTDKRIIQLFRLIDKNFPAEKKKRGKNKIEFTELITIESIRENIINALNRKENLGEVASGIKDLTKEMEEANCKTIGQYFYKLYLQNQKEDEKINIRKRYTAREQHYLEEFELICKIQEIDGINENEESPEKRYTGLVQKLYKAIFYQRPLKSQKGLVGKCKLEKHKPRCPISHPDFEECRALQFINNIEYRKSKEENWDTLTKEQKNIILPLFIRKSSPTFNFIEVKEKLTPKNENWEFNYSDKHSVSGRPFAAQLKNIFGEQWENEIYNNYTLKEFKKKTGTKSIDEVINDIWHVLFTFDKKERLKEFAKANLQCDERKAKQFSEIRLKQEYGSLSLRAIKKILPFLKEGYIFPRAVLLANMREVLGGNIWNDEKNRELVKQKLPSIINSYNENKKKFGIVNDLIYNFNQSYSNTHKDYVLDDKDKEEVLAKIEDSYGKISFNKLKVPEQVEIKQWVETHYQHQLRQSGKSNGTFIKIQRLDDVIIEELISIFGKENVHPDKLFHPSDIEIYPKQTERLGSPIIPSIKNPMAMRTLHQLRKLINALINDGIIDDETRVHIELARELNDVNKRKAIKKYQDELKDKRETNKSEIKELYKEQCGKEIEPTEDELLKFQLWKEQETNCIYTGATIKICDFIGTPEPKYDIEHTLPRSDSQDNSQMNKTLANVYYNRQIKGNLLPVQLPNYNERKELALGGQKKSCEAILDSIEHWKIKAEGFEEQFNKRAKPRGLETKEQKDKRIQEKHYYKMLWDYWQGKYDRFTMDEIKKGFKNSQKSDTGIITKYSRAYLYSYFPVVFSYKGELVAEFRRRWGLQNDYEKKERTNHIHHCIDAVTIACMTKQNYDLLAQAWTSEDAGNKPEAREILEKAKPWVKFTEDLQAIESEVPVSHYTPDNIRKQTKKKLRKRGKIIHKAIYELDANEKPNRDTDGKKIIKEFVYESEEDGNLIPAKGKKLTIDSITGKKEGEDYFSFVNKKTGEIRYYEFVFDKNKQKVYKKAPIYQQGDTVRGALHMETFYGAIKRPMLENGKVKKEDNGNIIFEKDDEGKDKIHYVIRKELTKLKAGDVDNIVDENIREIIIKAIKDKKISFNKNNAIVKETIWQNFEKKIPINKVRCYASVTEPLHIKEHRDKKATHQHKWQYHVQNDTNYAMAIYEGKDKKGNVDRVCELINTIDAGNYYKLSNKEEREQYPLAPEKHLETGYTFKTLLTKGKMVLIYLESPKEIWDLAPDKRLERLYVITGLDKDGIKLYYHQEARSTTDVLAFMNEIITQQNMKDGKVDKEGKSKQSKLTSPKGGDVIGKNKEFPYIKFKPNGFNALIEGIDFKISSTGKIEKITRHAQTNSIL